MVWCGVVVSSLSTFHKFLWLAFMLSWSNSVSAILDMLLYSAVHPSRSLCAGTLSVLNTSYHNLSLAQTMTLHSLWLALLIHSCSLQKQSGQQGRCLGSQFHFICSSVMKLGKCSWAYQEVAWLWVCLPHRSLKHISCPHRTLANFTLLLLPFIRWPALYSEV